MAKVHRTFVGQKVLTVCATFMMLSAGQVHAGMYRCEMASGQPGAKPEIRYQAQACEGGRALQVADQRTDAQRADTHKATQSTAKLGKQLERDRLRQEKKAAGQRPTAMDASPAKPKATENQTQGQTLKRQRHFTAKVPKTQKPD